MKTKIVVSYFLNRVEFFFNDDCEDYRNFHNIKKVVFEEIVNRNL